MLLLNEEVDVLMNNEITLPDQMCDYFHQPCILL